MSTEPETIPSSSQLLDLHPVPTALEAATTDEEFATENPVDGGVVAQLHALYAERALLHEALGTADAASIVAMVSSLEAQLVDLYHQRRRTFVGSTTATDNSYENGSKLTSQTEARDDG
ncbi:MAG: hypothetical protein KC502_21535 [Myxococcales bacterium]|nr:hypothetical protein [Myxococcales bacterium]